MGQRREQRHDGGSRPRGDAPSSGRLRRRWRRAVPSPDRYAGRSPRIPRGVDSARGASVTAEVTSTVVAIPGPLSYQEGRPFILPNLPGWAPHISNALLTEALGFTAMIVHDTDLGVLGEHAFGTGRGGGGPRVHHRQHRGRRRRRARRPVCSAGSARSPRSRPFDRAQRTSSSRARCPQTEPRLHARRHSAASTADALAQLF